MDRCGGGRSLLTALVHLVASLPDRFTGPGYRPANFMFRAVAVNIYLLLMSRSYGFGGLVPNTEVSIIWGLSEMKMVVLRPFYIRTHLHD